MNSLLSRTALGLAMLAACAAAASQPGSQADADRRARNVDEALANYHAQHDGTSARMAPGAVAAHEGHASLRTRTHDTANSVRNFTHRQANSVRRFTDRQNRRSHIHTAPNPNAEGGSASGE